eukprot:g11763.t1
MIHRMHQSHGRGFCKQRDFETNYHSALPKSHQWLSLTREDALRFAKYVIRGLNYWIFNALLTPYTQVFGTGATDEAVISASLVASMVGEDAGVREKRGPFADPAKTPLQRNAEPRNFHKEDEHANGPNVRWRPSARMMRSLVKYTGYMFARKMGTTQEGGKSTLKWDLSKEAWEPLPHLSQSAPLSLSELWNERADTSDAFEFEAKAPNRFRKAGKFMFGKNYIPTALHAPDGSTMQKAISKATEAGKKEAEKRGEATGPTELRQPSAEEENENENGENGSCSGSGEGD